MEKTFILLLVLFVSGPVPQTLGGFFDCTRNGLENLCDPNGQCSSDGLSCDCNVGMKDILGIHCLPVAVADPIVPCTAGFDCNGQGTCVKVDPSTDACQCNEAYTGTQCELPRAEVVCSNTDMEIMIRPFGQFSGKMFVEGHSGDTNCELQEDTTQSVTTYKNTFAYSSTDPTNCGITTFTSTDGTVGYRLSLLVIYNSSPDLAMQNDQRFQVSCTMDERHNVSSVSGSVNAADPNLSQDPLTAAAKLIDFEVTDPSGDALESDTDVTVGTSLMMVIGLRSNDYYSKLTVESCTAANLPETSNQDSDFQSLEIVTDSCPVQHKVVAGDHTLATTATGESEVKIPFYAFMFVKGNVDSKNSLYMSCTVRVCPSTSTECDAKVCTLNPSFTTGHGRRKRQAREDIVTVGQSFSVRYGNVTLEKEQKSRTRTQVTTTSCLENPQMQTIVALLGVALLALFITLVAVVVCLRRRPSQNKMVDDCHSTTSSTKDLTMQIPRPRV